ncbi:Retrovirus-related Pol polyprotein, partial [Mucuna pruriens]
MPFGLCNAPSTFQRYMMSIFSDLLQDYMEVFMDDFTVYAESFNICLNNLSKVLKRYTDTNLVLNFEKCHFMVIEGIVLGHLVSNRGIEVDKAKIDVITSLPNPTFVREVRSFLGHADNIPLLDAIKQIPKYAKFLKELCVHKRKKMKGSVEVGEPTRMTIHLANRSVVQPLGILEDVLIQVNELIFLVDFYVLDMEDETSGNGSTLILG